MITFFCCAAFLAAGYAFYGRLVEKAAKPTDSPTPAYASQDGVDYIPLPTWKVFLIQLLNIAGTGPIFGALMGAVFGPIVFLWIILGNILGGAVHDYMAGIISVRMNGASISEIVGQYLGNGMKQVMRAFSVGLLILSGAVFITCPAVLIASLTPAFLDKNFWVIVILIYYILATLLPIDKLIGKIYPVFGIVLILMVVLIASAIVIQGRTIPELTLANLHPDGLSPWPFMFITVACGAVSGFHSTQAPLMARCIKTERDARKAFYGAMVMEGVIALVWAAAGAAFYETTGGLQEALAGLGQSGVVYTISTGLLGLTGGILAVIGVIVCPISTGDTAFRSARLTIADAFHLNQKDLKSRIPLTALIMIVGGLLTLVDFDIIWRYMSWANQTLSCIVLWTAAVYLRWHAGRKACMITVIPAVFMTAVCTTYILMAPEGFSLPASIGFPAGALAAFLNLGMFMLKCYVKDKAPAALQLKPAASAG